MFSSKTAIYLEQILVIVIFLSYTWKCNRICVVETYWGHRENLVVENSRRLAGIFSHWFSPAGIFSHILILREFSHIFFTCGKNIIILRLDRLTCGNFLIILRLDRLTPRVFCQHMAVIVDIWPLLLTRARPNMDLMYRWLSRLLERMWKQPWHDDAHCRHFFLLWRSYNHGADSIQLVTI